MVVGDQVPATPFGKVTANSGAIVPSQNAGITAKFDVTGEETTTFIGALFIDTRALMRLILLLLLSVTTITPADCTATP